MFKNYLTLIFLIILQLSFFECHQHSQGGHRHHHTNEHETPEYMETFHGIFSSNISKIMISILLISLPSLPIFFLLQLITKCLHKDENETLKIMKTQILDKMIALSIGTIIGDIFLHMFPEFDELTENKEKNYLFIMIGIIGFYACDYLIQALSSQNPHAHSHGKNKKTVKAIQSSSQFASAFTYLLGDFLHNFTDGIAIGASYSVSYQLGITTTIAIALHEIPHEIGDFAFLMKQNYSLFAIFKTQVFTSLGAFLGGITGIYCGNAYKIQLLGFTIGTFLYLCLTILLPDIVFKKSQGFLTFNFNVIFMCLGIYLMKILLMFE